MITQIEQALIDRLKRGLGKMVVDVASYAGELDDAQLAVKRLPVVLVSYAGSVSEPKGMTAQGARHLTTTTFAVLVLVGSIRTDERARYGTALRVGANDLLEAVKYLLTNQTLGKLVSPLRPTKVQTVLNNAEIGREKLTAYAVEFQMQYSEPPALEDGRFPEGADVPEQLEYLFKHYQGELSLPVADLRQFHNRIYDPTTGAETALAVMPNGDASGQES